MAEQFSEMTRPIIDRALKVIECSKKYATVSAAYLFGSHVNGNTHEWSDIDIAMFI